MARLFRISGKQITLIVRGTELKSVAEGKTIMVRVFIFL